MKRYFKAVLMILVIVFTNSIANGQDGEALFKAKCSACHKLGDNSTGPNLKGVKQKWADAEEGDLLYDWIKNSEALIAAGTSKMAAEVKDYSPGPMTPQDVSPEEIDAILDFVDNFVVAPKVEGPPSGDVSGVEVPITYVPNYKQNLSLFWWLIAAAAILLFSIFMMSGSVRTLVNSDILKQKLIEREKNSGVKNILLLIGGFGLITASNLASAFTFNGPGMAQEGAPWLLIENSDLYILIAINLVLVGVLYYVRGLFKEFMNIISPPVIKEVEAPAISKKLNKILVNAVEIEDEKSILMDHEYDGIQELDNNLPPWWVWMFYTTIIAGVIYIFNYHILGTGDLQIAAYDKEIVRADKEKAAYLDKMAMNVDETNATLMTEASDLSSGKGLFEVNCISCHNPKGEGLIGPNLTDDFWLYGNDIKDLFNIVKNGDGKGNGMPEHASKLNPIQIQQVSSFVLSLPYTKGKDPQGTEIKD